MKIIAKKKNKKVGWCLTYVVKYPLCAFKKMVGEMSTKAGVVGIRNLMEQLKTENSRVTKERGDDVEISYSSRLVVMNNIEWIFLGLQLYFKFTEIKIK